MRSLADVLLAALGILVAVAVLGDEVSRVVDSLVLPLCALVVVIVAARLVWFYTSRW